METLTLAAPIVGPRELQAQAPVLELAAHELTGVCGGAATGSPELAEDIGKVLGAAVAMFFLVGVSFYRTGGLTGGNPWLNRKG